MRLNAIEPGTFRGQLTQQKAYFPGAFGDAVMLFEPGAYLLDVPTGIFGRPATTLACLLAATLRTTMNCCA